MGEMVTFPSDGDRVAGYLSTPSSGTPGQHPSVVVIQEWWGLVPHIRSVVDRLAAEGFTALAPDLYRGASATEPDEAMRLMMGLAMDQAARDIASAAGFLATRTERARPVGVVGFCLGGSLALWAATLTDHITAVASFYPSQPWERMRPDWAGYRGKRVVIHCAEGDGASRAPGIQRIKEAIEQAGGICILYDYPGTTHAFFNDDRPEVYDSEAAALAWARTLDLFHTALT